LRARARAATRNDPEPEILDTGVFDGDRYFDVVVEYAKGDADDLLIRLTIHNRGPEASSIVVLPQLWFRNTWSWSTDSVRPELFAAEPLGDVLVVQTHHDHLGVARLYAEG